MPQYQPITVSYSKGGLDNSQASFNDSNDAFQELTNAFNFRGRIRRRLGYELLGRLRRVLTAQNLGNTDGAGNFSGNIITILLLEANADIQPGSVTVTIGGQVFTEPATPDGTLSNGGLGTGTINYSTGALTIDTDPNLAATAVVIDFSYYPQLPCMGLSVFETTSRNNENLVAFDTRYAYTFSVGLNAFIQLGTPTTWQGDNADFFYTTNVLTPGAANFLFFATNFNTGLTPDPIRYFDGTIWNNFAPFLDTPNTIQLHQALIIVQYRGRVVFLNTFEGATLAGSSQFSQRARWSQFGNVLDANAFLDDVGGRGGFIDCPTSEAIISADFIRDTLIVGFERSTWKLRYTSNEITPFVWERINKELGVESTFSTVSFDKGILGVGDKSINVCDGNSVEPIDQNIPDEVFEIHNGSDGPFRVHGIRDFFLRQVYWTYPDSETNPTFPNRMFVYDYEQGSWAIFTDSFTVLGTFQKPSGDRWIDLPIQWQNHNIAWNSARHDIGFPMILGGNQQGYVETLNERVGNDVSLYISDITGGATPVVITSINHNLEGGEFIRLTGIIGAAFSSLNDTTYFITVIDDDNFEIATRDTNGNYSSVILPDGEYLGLGEIIRVFNFRIRSKKFNVMQEGSRGNFGYIDFLVRSTTNGEVACEIRTDYNESVPINEELPGTGNNFYNNTFSTQTNVAFNNAGEEIWKRFFCPTNAQFFDFTLTFNDRQMVDNNINSSEVYIDSLIVWASKGARLVK